MLTNISILTLARYGKNRKIQIKGDIKHLPIYLMYVQSKLIDRLVA